MDSFKIKEANSNLWIMFFTWPLITFIESIRNYRECWAKNGLWLFIIFFGFTFISREGSDSSRYIEWFQEFHQSGNDLSTIKSMLYTEGSRYIDVYQPLITAIVAQFTDDSRILFLIFAFVFGFFYTRNIWYLLEKTDKQLDFYLKILIIIFSLTVPFWLMNGVRFWTAAHVFFYGALPFLIDKQKRGLWISGLSVFVHFSFIFPVLLLLTYRMFGNRTTVFFIFFVISLFISEINIQYFRDTLITYTPEIFHHSITTYTNEEYIESRNIESAERNWYVIWYTKTLRISVSLLLIVIFIKGKVIWKRRTGMLRLFSFFLLFGGFANLISSISSLGRFLSVANLFSISFLFLYFYFNNSEIFSKKLFLLLTPALALYFVVTVRTGFDYIGLYSIITNPFIAPYLENKIALIDLIK